MQTRQDRRFRHRVRLYPVDAFLRCQNGEGANLVDAHIGGEPRESPVIQSNLAANAVQYTPEGGAIAITVLGFNLTGDWLRDRLDPRLR